MRTDSGVATVGWAKARSSRAVPTRTSVAVHEVPLLSIFACKSYHFGAPITLQVAPCNIMLETAVRPITDAADQPVLDRIEMDVFHVSTQILVVANPMLPKAPLPDTFLPLQHWRVAARVFRPNGGTL